MHPLHLTFFTDQPVFPMKLTRFSSHSTEVLVYAISDHELNFPGALIEWAYWVDREIISKYYPVLDMLVEGNVFITKSRKTFLVETSDYTDIQFVPTAQQQNADVWPPQLSMGKGGAQRFHAKGGMPPYNWNCSDESVGTIDPETGEFESVAAGNCVITTRDANGITSSPTPVTVSDQPAPTISEDNNDDLLGCFLQCVLQSWIFK